MIGIYFFLVININIPTKKYISYLNNVLVPSFNLLYLLLRNVVRGNNIMSKDFLRIYKA